MGWPQSRKDQIRILPRCWQTQSVHAAGFLAWCMQTLPANAVAPTRA